MKNTINNARHGKLLYMTPETKKYLNALERKVNRLETLQHFFDGTLKKDFFSQDEWHAKNSLLSQRD